METKRLDLVAKMERIVCIAVAVMLFFFSYSAKADELDDSLASAEKSLSKIEQDLNSVEITKEVRKSNNAVEANLDNYLKQMASANDMKLKKFKKKAEDGNSAEAGNDLDSWESTLARHKARTEQVSNRIKQISADISEGKITVSREVIEEFSDDELEGFRKSVKEDVLHKKYSDIGAFRKDSFKWVSELLSPSEANAAMAVVCVYTCVYSTPDNCVACIGTAGILGAKLYPVVKNAVDNCNRYSYAYQRFFCKAAVIAGYISLIA